MMIYACRIAAIALACSILSPAALGQEGEKTLRWKLEDAVGAPGWLSLSGHIRPRYETLSNQFAAGRTGDDEFFGVQTLLKAEIDTGAIVVGGELLDSRRVVGNAGGATSGQIETFEPMQAYLAWRPSDFLIEDAELDLMLGRFTMDIGGRRLVARSNFGSVPSSFDGARALWRGPGGAELIAFYTAPVVRQPADVPSRLGNEAAFNETAEETRFAGAHLGAPLGLAITGEVYLFTLDEDDGADQATRNRDLSTTGLRIVRAPESGAFDADFEYAWQTGTVRGSSNPADITDLAHDATMLHAEAGYSFDAPWSPRLSLHYDLASGDGSSGDISSERFDPLFGDRSFELGPTSIFGAISRTNLDSPGVRIDAKPDNVTDAYVMVRQIKLESATDSFGATGVRDASGMSGNDVATQIEGRWRRWLVPDQLRLSLGAAALLHNDFLEAAPNATGQGDTFYGYSELTFSF